VFCDVHGLVGAGDQGFQIGGIFILGRNTNTEFLLSGEANICIGRSGLPSGDYTRKAIKMIF
jgi:hypothetical protein